MSMASSLDRSQREAAKKKNEAAEERKRVKEDRKNDVQAKKQRKTARSKNKKKSAARYDTRAMMKTMAMSVSILLLVFLILEAVLLIWKAVKFGPGDTSYTNNDTYWHLLNISDTCIGFLVGILAMDILNYFERGQKARRDEERAIIRHNRIVKPAIDMYLARKNSLITPAGEDFKPFQVVTNATPRDLKDLFGDDVDQLATTRTNIPVLTCLHLNGLLSSPTLSFSLELPMSDQTIQQQVIGYSHRPGDRNAVRPNYSKALCRPYVTCFCGRAACCHIHHQCNSYLRCSLRKIQEEYFDKHHALTIHHVHTVLVIDHLPRKIALPFLNVAYYVKFAQ